MVIKLIAALCMTGPAWAGWQALGPFGGAAAVVAADPRHAGTVLAATSNALLFRSEDSGEHWRGMPFPPQLRSVLHAFIVDAAAPDTYFAGVASEAPEYSGVFRSADAGATWRALPGLRGKEVWSLASWPPDPKVMAAGTRGGVFLTRDGGENWTRISWPENRDMEVVVSLAFDPSDDRILYAGTPHLPWKTIDGGATWTSIHAGMLDDSDVFSIAVDRAHPQRVFASACSGIYSSRNGAASWTKLAGAPGASYRTYFVAQDPREQDVVFAGTTHGLVRSTDGGATWRQLSPHLTRWVAFDPQRPRRIYIATADAGMLRSDDEGDTLREINEGFCNRHLPSLAVAGGALYTNTIYEAANGGVFRMRAEGGAWEAVAPESRLLGEQALALAGDGADAARLYAAGYNSLLVSGDAGRNWAALPRAFGPARLTALLGPGADVPFLLAATERGLFRSADNGKTWKFVDTPPAGRAVRRLARMGRPGESGAVAAVGAGGILISSDGAEWRALGTLPGNAQPYEVADAGEGRLLAATSAGLMRWDASAQTWEAVGGGLAPGTVRAVYRHPGRAGTFFAAQYGDVYESSDNGGSWSKISPGTSTITIQQLAVLPGRADLLFALTPSQGVFALPLETLASGGSDSQGLKTGAERGTNEK